MSYVEAFDMFDGPLTRRPTNRVEVANMFGDPTRGGLYKKVADPSWVKRSITELHGEHAFLPCLARYYFPIHKYIEPYAREAFKRAELACPGYITSKGTWGYNFRHIRHKDSSPLSYHAYGIAIDINPTDNGGKELKDAPEPWSEAWWKLWPRGVPEGVVRAFESCGFSWGGWWKEYVDPMHVEWVGRRETKV